MEVDGRESGRESADRRWVGIGILIWLLVSSITVVVRGVRLDETYEHAQVLAGLVQYPAGHPFVLYLDKLVSLQSSAAALLVRMLPDPVFLSALRNVVSLLATVLPPFLLTTLVARSTVWAHAAALFTLMGFHWCFGSYYPLFTWPGDYSVGHVGMACALIVFYLLSSGRLRAGFFLLGLMPAIHLGQLPVVFLAALLMLARWARQRRRDLLRTAGLWTSAGLAVFLVSLPLLISSPPPAPEGGGYDVSGDVWEIWRGFTTHFDDHRGYTGSGTLLNSFVAIAVAFLFGGAAVYLESGRGNSAGPWFWLWTYAALASAIFVGVRLVHFVMGPQVPFWMISWMPYRMVNHTILIAVAMLAGILGQAARESRGLMRAAVGVTAAVLLFGVARPFLPGLTDAETYARFFAIGAPAAFVFIGGALAVMSARLRGCPRFQGIWLALVLALSLVLVWSRPSWASSLGLGGVAVVAASLPMRGRAGSDRAALGVLALVCAVVTTVLVGAQAPTRAHMVRTDFEGKVAGYLRDAGRPNTVLLGEPLTVFLQAKLSFPVAADAVTASLISYRPDLGPVIQAIYDDLYGLRFDGAGELPAAARGWRQLAGWRSEWERRSRDDWRRLGERYSVAFVIAPAGLAVDLPAVLRGADRTLYRIPAPGEISEDPGASDHARRRPSRPAAG